MTEPSTVLRIQEIEPVAVAGVRWHPLRRALGIDAFGINAYSAAAAALALLAEGRERFPNDPAESASAACWR